VLVSFAAAIAAFEYLGEPTGTEQAAAQAGSQSSTQPPRPLHTAAIDAMVTGSPQRPAREAITIAASAPGALERFFDALADLETGRRTRPVTILHLGDGHVSGDRLDVHLRSLFQARFGDAGRGLLLPGNAYKGYRARGLRFSSTGAWSVASADGAARGVFGLTGVQASATSPDASLTVASPDDPFEAAEVAFLAAPDRGAATVAVDGRAYSVVTRAEEPGIQRVRVNLGGSALAVRPAGTGPVTLVAWSLIKNRAGVRYVSVGRPGAMLETLLAADDLVLADEMRALRPDLLVLGYGTSEGLDDSLDVGRFAQAAGRLAERLKSLAPEAALLVIGPPDASRIPDFASKEARTSPSTACRALTPEERQRHARMIEAKDERLARWHPPPRLDDVRLALQRVAVSHSAYWWDWSNVMGGACGIHVWARARPELALPDHVHLTDEGYQRSAKALFSELIQGYSARRQVARQAQ
jgi:lysophospholipase L1-like esterase